MASKSENSTQSSVLPPSSSNPATSIPSNNPILQNLPTNPRGIPTAPYFETLSSYGIHTHADVEPTLRSFQEMISKYQFMELNVSKRGDGLREKVPEMQGTLETVRFLIRKKSKSSAAHNGNSHADDDDLATSSPPSPSSASESKTNTNNDDVLTTTFSLNDTLYARAHIHPSTLEEVYLWLGANVMVAYPLHEAEEMLASRLEAAQRKLKDCEEDAEFLREQITTMEVATARVWNWDVGERRKGNGGQDEGDKEGDGDGR